MSYGLQALGPAVFERRVSSLAKAISKLLKATFSAMIKEKWDLRWAERSM